MGTSSSANAQSQALTSTINTVVADAGLVGDALKAAQAIIAAQNPAAAVVSTAVGIAVAAKDGTQSSQFVPDGSAASYNLVSDGNTGSITFSGGSERLQFTLSVGSTTSSSRTMQVAISTNVAAEAATSLEVLGIGFTLDDAWSITTQSTHGATSSSQSTTSTTVTVVLEDPDVGGHERT